MELIWNIKLMSSKSQTQDSMAFLQCHYNRLLKSFSFLFFRYSDCKTGLWSISRLWCYREKIIESRVWLFELISSMFHNEFYGFMHFWSFLTAEKYPFRFGLSGWKNIEILWSYQSHGLLFSFLWACVSACLVGVWPRM